MRRVLICAALALTGGCYVGVPVGVVAAAVVNSRDLPPVHVTLDSLRDGDDVKVGRYSTPYASDRLRARFAGRRGDTLVLRTRQRGVDTTVALALREIEALEVVRGSRPSTIRAAVAPTLIGTVGTLAGALAGAFVDQSRRSGNSDGAIVGALVGGLGGVVYGVIWGVRPAVPRWVPVSLPPRESR